MRDTSKYAAQHDTLQQRTKPPLFSLLAAAKCARKILNGAERRKEREKSSLARLGGKYHNKV